MSDPVDDQERSADAVADDMQRTERKKRRWKIVGLTLGGVGTAQTIVAVLTGGDFNVQQWLFYLGSAAFAVPVSMASAGVLVLPALWVYRRVKGLDEDDPQFRKVMFVLLAVGGAIVYIPLTRAGRWFDYDGSDGVGRLFLAVVGLVVISLAIWQWLVNERRLKGLAAELRRRPG